MRIVLLGDSIIDNGVYVAPGEPSVTEQLQKLLPLHIVERRALDGAVAADVLRSQTSGLDAFDRIILSAGGNDLLQHIDLLDAAFEEKSRDVLVKLWTIREAFRETYAALLDRLAAARRLALVLTVYNPCFAGFGMEQEDQRAAEAGLSLVNDVIQQEARARSFDVLEIRTLFCDAADYANPIEPSAIGGAKLAEAMGKWVKANEGV